MQEVERLKSEERYFHAGALAYALGCDNNYGCHYGMFSSRENAISQYKRGYEEARLHCEITFR